MIKPLAIFLAFVLASQPAGADCQSATGSFRKCYDNENAPTALVFKLFVRTLFSDSLENEEHQLGWRYVHAGLTANMNADDVIHYFVSRFLDIEKEVEDAQELMLCSDRKPRYEGVENFVIFNQMDEMSLNIYEKHLLLARSDLVATGLFDLDKALEEHPGSFTSTFTDHEKTHGGSTQQIYELAEHLCAEPRTFQFSSSRNLSGTELRHNID